MKILHLTLKKKWFDMIASGEKKEEYREVKDYWKTRLVKHWCAVSDGKAIPVVRFRNGYNKISPQMDVQLLSLGQRVGKPEWGAEEGKVYYVLVLGKVLNQEQEVKECDATKFNSNSNA